MTAEEFRTRWTGHVPKVQDVTGEYAVLVPLVERPEGLCLLYEVRADTLGRQPGGGVLSRRAAGAGEDAVSCALRETWEELGIPRAGGGGGGRAGLGSPTRGALCSIPSWGSWRRRRRSGSTPAPPR